MGKQLPTVLCKFDNYHTFRVIVKTQEYTEFILIKKNGL